MKLRLAIISSVAVMAVAGAAIADQGSENAARGDKTSNLHGDPGGDPGGKPMGDAIIRIATVTQQIAQIASTTAVIGPAPPRPVAAAAAQAAARPRISIKPATTARVTPRPQQKLAAAASHVEPPASDLRPYRIRCVGAGEMGKAAWYGGHYVGQQTSSGDRLDTIHPTAAHRTLPLNSLALVTNLKNGRTVVVKVTDRGPVSTSLLIDMSPRAAEQLAMKDAGVVPVKVEQVVEVPPDAK